MKHFKGIRYTVALLSMLAVLMAPAMASAALTVPITIDVTPSYVAINNTNSSTNFGTLAAGLTNATANSTVDWFDIGNAGTVNATVSLVCDNWTFQTGSNSWTYGSPAEDTGQLVFSAGTGAYDVVVPGTTPAELFADLEFGTVDYFEIGIDMPTSFTHGDQQQTVLTVSAVAV